MAESRRTGPFFGPGRRGLQPLMGRAQARPRSGWEQPPPDEPTRLRVGSSSAMTRWGNRAEGAVYSVAVDGFVGAVVSSVSISISTSTPFAVGFIPDIAFIFSSRISMTIFRTSSYLGSPLKKP